MIRSIVHPTDFSPASDQAFDHAVRLALINRCQLFVLHVRHPNEQNDWQSFPRIRETMQRWGFVKQGAQPKDILAETGVEVIKAEIPDGSAGDGLSRFIQSHRPGLVVMASRGHAGLKRWLSASVSAEVVRGTLVPTMIFGPEARPFVDAQTGACGLKSVLVPVDHDPAPDSAVHLLGTLVDGMEVNFDFVHVGDHSPVLNGGQTAERSVRLLNGPVVDTILQEAQQAQLIAMPMVGREGFWDTIRGSTTERVVSEVTCPVLALPVTA